MSWQCPECENDKNDVEVMLCDCGYVLQSHNLLDEIKAEQQKDLEHSSNLQSRPTLRRKKHPWLKGLTVKKIVGLIALFFLILNIGVYGKVLGGQAVGRPNFSGKAYMAGAYVTSICYVFPLSVTFGPGSIIANPFNKFRDFLIERSASKFPINDAEFFLWKYFIRHSFEYKYFNKREFNLMLGEKGRLGPDYFMELSEDLYDLLEPLALLPLSDP